MPGPAALEPFSPVSLSGLSPAVRAQIGSAQDIWRRNPNDARVNLETARILLAYEYQSAAVSLLRRAAAFAPQNFAAVYLLAWTEAAEGNRSAALDAYNRALALNPEYLPARLKRAELLFQLGESRKSIREYRRILKQHRLQAQAHFGLGRVLAAAGDWKAAIAAYNDACWRDDRFAAAHYALAEAYQRCGDTEQSRRHRALYAAYRNEEPPLADEILEQVHALNQSARGLKDRIQKLVEAEAWRDAADLLERAVANEPSYLAGHVNLVTCYGKLGEMDKAEAHYRAALSLSPASPELQNARGVIFAARGRHAEARRSFLAALASDPYHSGAYQNLGLLEYEEGRLAAALRHYQSAVSIAPSSAGSWIMIGTIHLQEGRDREAREAFLRAVRPDRAAESMLRQINAAYKKANDWQGWTAFAEAAMHRAEEAGMQDVKALLAGTLQPR